ncbi:MAG: SDR family oxidoreductase [Roseibium sp.]
MKQILLTGGTGRVGRFIADRLKQDGHCLTHLGRTPPADTAMDFAEWDLSSRVLELPAADALIHCALNHAPGLYEGGEGDDPHEFIELNVGGTARLFETAKSAGIRHCVFLSSQAVYSDPEDWAVIRESFETRPGTLYGQAKLAGEQALELLCDQTMVGSALRVTHVYGCPPGSALHPWSDLFDDFEQGKQVEPHLGTYVNGECLAEAVALILKQDPSARPNFDAFNISDLLLDTQDLLKSYAVHKGISQSLPPRKDAALGVLEAGKLKALGWTPGGKDKLAGFLQSL